MPGGNYLLMAVARIGGEPVMGKIMDIDVPEPLEKRLKTLKGLPLTPQDIETLQDNGEFGGRKLRFLSNMYQPTLNAPVAGVKNRSNLGEGKKANMNDTGKKTKAGYSLQTYLLEVKEKSMTQYKPDKDFNLNVFIIDMSDKVVEKKQEKWEPRTGSMSGELPYGCYLVVAWADCKGQRIGKCYHVSLGRSY